MYKLILLITLAALSCSYGVAQDTITMKSGTLVIGSISGFDSSNVFVNQPNVSSDISIPLNIVQSIKFGDKRGAFTFREHNDTTFNHKRAITTSVFAPLFNHTDVGFEIALKPGRSLHMIGGIIFSNFGTNTESHLQGAYFRTGFRLYINPEKYSGIHSKQHLFGDFYEFMISGMRYSYQRYYYDTDYIRQYNSNTITSLSVQFIYGFQSKMSKNWFWGINVGAGYTYTFLNNDATDYICGDTEFIYLRPANGLPFSVTGMVCFGKKF